VRKRRRKRRPKRVKTLNTLIFHAMIYLNSLKYGVMEKFSSRRTNLILIIKRLQLKENG
jgi:hypothetical protein